MINDDKKQERKHFVYTEKSYCYLSGVDLTGDKMLISAVGVSCWILSRFSLFNFVKVKVSMIFEIFVLENDLDTTTLVWRV